MTTYRDTTTTIIILIVVAVSRGGQKQFNIIPNVGHSYSEPGTLTALLAATEKYKQL